MTTALVGYYDGDTLRLRYRANTAPTSLDAFVLYEYDKEPGRAYKETVSTITSFTTNWSEVELEGDPAGGGSRIGCKVTGGGVFVRDTAAGTSRGSLYARFVVARGGSAYEECLCCGYVDTYKPFLSIGEHEPIQWTETVAVMDVTYTQANVAGGAIVVEIVPGSGNAFMSPDGGIINSGTNGISYRLFTVAGGTAIKALNSNLASGAGTVLYVGTSAGTATKSSGQGSGDLGQVVAGTQALRIEQTVAGAQNDTFRILLTIRVKGGLPTVSKANSTNQADVTVTSGSAAFTFIP